VSIGDGGEGSETRKCSFCEQKEPKKLWHEAASPPARLRSHNTGGSQAHRQNFNQLKKFFWFFFVHKKEHFLFPIILINQILKFHNTLKRVTTRAPRVDALTPP